jgi:GxxExxY protein
MLVDDAVIVEVKAHETVLAVHKAQLLSYLKLARKKAGLVTNFNVARLVDGVHTVANAL